MEEELRFGKYTNKQIEEILRAGLFPHENELLNSGLQLLELNFQEFFFPTDESILIDGNKLDILNFPKYKPLEKIIDIRKKLSDEQNLIIDKFFLLTFKVLHLNTHFLILNGEKDEAIQGYEGILRNNVDLKIRFNEEFPNELLEQSFKSMQEFLNTQKQNSINALNWDGNDDLKYKISLKLFINGTTCSETSFIDVFDKNKKCEILKDKRGFFVMLIYALVDYEKPLLTSKNDSVRGVIKAANKCFFENTRNGEIQISFTDVKKRIIEKNDLSNQLKLEVSDFMQEFEPLLSELK